MLLWRYLYLSRSRTRAGVLDCALQAVTGQGEVTAVPGVTCLTFRLGTELLIVVLHKAASFKVKQDVGIFIPGILYPRSDGVMSFFSSHKASLPIVQLSFCFYPHPVNFWTPFFSPVSQGCPLTISTSLFAALLGGTYSKKENALPTCLAWTAFVNLVDKISRNLLKLCGYFTY